jgi:hypothetical protein
VVRNWFARYNATLLLPNDNFNKYVHGLEEQFPYQGAALAVHLGRLISIVAGACTLVVVYCIGRTIAPSHPCMALMATALVACIPGFISLHSFITNDTFVILFATLSIWIALRTAREGPTYKLAFLGGLWSGLTVLSKLNGIWVAIIVWLAFILFAFNHRHQRPFLSVLPPLLLSVGVWLVITGWWFAYGLLQGGDPLGIAIHASYTWQSPTHIAIPQPNEWLADLWEWDHYTWGVNMMWPEWIYSTFRFLYLIGILMAGIFGIQAFARRGRQFSDIQQAFYLSLAVAFALLGGLYWQFVYDWRIGRLLYPGLTSAAIIAAAGWAWGFSKIQKSNLPRFGYYGSMITIALLIQGASIGGTIYAIDTYAPPIVPVQSLANFKQTILTFVDPTNASIPVATITGYDVPPQDVRAGGFMTATVCWKSNGYTRSSYPYALQLVGPGDVQPGTRNSYHGLGNYPLATWQPGKEFCDPTSLPIGPYAIDKPRAYNLVLTLFEIQPPGLTVRSVLTAYDDAHRQVYPMLTRVRVAPQHQPIVTPTVNLGDVAGLVQAHWELGTNNTLNVQLRWVALNTTDTNAKVFLHIVDKASGKTIAQNDHEPDAGWFPTNYWQKGDVVDDQFAIVLPEGVTLDNVSLQAGMYDAQSQIRLPAVEVATHEHFRDDIVSLTQ